MCCRCFFRGILLIALLLTAHEVQAATYPPDITNLVFLQGITDQLCYPTSTAVCITQGMLNVDQLTSSFNDGVNETDQWNVDLLGLWSFAGGTPTPIDLTGFAVVEFLGLNGSSPFGTFNSLMADIFVQGSGGGHSLRITNDTASRSTGQAIIADIGGQPVFQANSFFDIFTDLSVDLGTFTESTNPPVHLATASIPEPVTGILPGIPLMLLTFRLRRITQSRTRSERR